MEPSINTYCYIARNRKQVSCSLHEDTIHVSVQAKNQLAKAYTFRYAEIDRIHLSLPDISWHTIDIYFRDKTHIHLKSLTFFIEREGKLMRPKTNQTDAAIVRRNQSDYRLFVVELHNRVHSLQTTSPIQFTHGNPWKKTIIWLALLALAIAIPILWEIGNYRLCFFFGSAFLLLFLFNIKINFRKRYSPEHIPQKYLPRTTY